jgi:hypothetical protein
MNLKEEMTKLLIESYDQGVADAKQVAIAALEQTVAAARADEREACAKEADKWSKRDDDAGAFIGKAIRNRGNT